MSDNIKTVPNTGTRADIINNRGHHMSTENKLEQVKTELADAIRVWYLRHAEDIAGNAGKDAEFSQTYGDGGNVGTWAGDLAAKVAADAGDMFSGSAASVRLTKGIQALAGRPATGGMYIDQHAIRKLDETYEIDDTQRGDMLRLLDSIKRGICADGLADWAPIKRAPGTSDLAWAVLRLAAQYLAEGARFQGLAFADVYKTVGGLNDFQQVADDAAKTIEQAARGKIATDLNITAGPAAFKVDDYQIAADFLADSLLSAGADISGPSGA